MNEKSYHQIAAQASLAELTNIKRSAVVNAVSFFLRSQLTKKNQDSQVKALIMLNRLTNMEGASPRRRSRREAFEKYICNRPHIMRGI